MQRGRHGGGGPQNCPRQTDPTGQTCIAPDYVLLPQGREAEFEQAFARAVGQLFPTLAGNADYASIVSDRHFARLHGLLDEAQAAGTRVVQAGDHGADHAAHPAGQPNATQVRQMAPVLVFNPPAHSRLMTEEIFGPILPVLTYRTLADAVAHINASLAWRCTGLAPMRPRATVLSQTVSGGVTINDTLLHIAHHNLPFGGVGESGWGSYHGEAGFAFHPAKTGAGAIALGHGAPVLPTLWRAVSTGHGAVGAGFEA